MERRLYRYSCPLIFQVVIGQINTNNNDEFRVATPDETTGKETEFSLVVSLEIKYK